MVCAIHDEIEYVDYKYKDCKIVHKKSNIKIIHIIKINILRLPALKIKKYSFYNTI